MSNLRFFGLASAVLATVAFTQAPASARDMPKHGGEEMVEHMCAAKGATPDDFPDRVSKRLNLSDAQKAALTDLRDTHHKARTDAAAALCSPKPDLSTFSGRLAFHEKILESHLATMKATRPKLEAFYNGLDDKQKKAFAKEAARLGR